jgi:hypothetical protein
VLVCQQLHWFSGDFFSGISGKISTATILFGSFSSKEKERGKLPGLPGRGESSVSVVYKRQTPIFQRPIPAAESLIIKLIGIKNNT